MKGEKKVGDKLTFRGRGEDGCWFMNEGSKFDGEKVNVAVRNLFKV